MSMNITKTPLAEIQMLWVSGNISNLERLSINSFIKNGHTVRLFSYDEIPDLPVGTIVADANEIIPEKNVFTNPANIGKGGLSVFSNFFRYQLLFERGGVWSDIDMVCLKPIDIFSSEEYVIASENVLDGNATKPIAHVQNCIIKVPPRSNLISRSLAIAEETNLMTAPWGSTGPKALHQSVEELGFYKFVKDPNTFCSCPYWLIYDLLRDSNFYIPPWAYGLHFYNEILRRNFVDKNATFDPLCLFERLKKYYGVSGHAQQII